MLWFTHGMAVAARESLQLKYDGPALDDHSIDVRQLAPSLLALADLCDMAHARSGDVLGVAPALQVTATREGSFFVDLYLVIQEAGGTIKDLMTSETATAAANGIGISALIFGALRWTLRRRTNGPESGTHELEQGRIRVNWPDGTYLDVPYGARSLVESLDFNRTAGYVFEPLREEGIDEVELIRGEDQESIVVRADDLRAFNILTPDDDLISDNVRLVNVRLRTVAFKEGNKWKVTDGASTFWASMADLEFLQRVRASEEAFAQGDVLYVRLREQQFRAVDGDFRMEHTIEKVLEHRRALPPDPIPFDDAD
jgi:hypothetical protein